jgi:hypothetical protein
VYISRIKKIAPETDRAHRNKVITTVALLGAKRPKLAKTIISQKTRTASNGRETELLGVSARVVTPLYSVRRDEDANGLLDMPDPLSLRQDIVCAEHRLIDGVPHDQPVELGSGDHRVADRQQAAIRPPL